MNNRICNAVLHLDDGRRTSCGFGHPHYRGDPMDPGHVVNESCCPGRHSPHDQLPINDPSRCPRCLLDRIKILEDLVQSLVSDGK